MFQKIKTRLLPLFFLLLTSLCVILPVSAADARKSEDMRAFPEVRLCPGGEVFGARILMPGAMVAGLSEVKTEAKVCRPAEEGGLLKKDLITHANGQKIQSAKQLTDLVEKSEGKPITLTVKRKDDTLTLTLTPALSSENGRYRLGIIVRDRTAGIGTVTFIDPKTGAFGGLGHGICDPESGEVLPIARGSVTDVHLIGITRGASNAPGELRGMLGHRRQGVLTQNSKSGVFGILTDFSPKTTEEALPLAKPSQVKVGKAEILCTLSDGQKGRYEIEITKIHEKNKDSKCFSIRVTDADLLAKTGGIVQGMSGSPIIQDGKLVGAVTHVTVNDPTAGYGIFIERMLAAAVTPALPKAA